jgi:hypothetical protein
MVLEFVGEVIPSKQQDVTLQGQRPNHLSGDF